MSSWVLDASALLALLNHEAGEERVAAALADGALISTVNLAEVVTRLAETGFVEAEIREAIGGVLLESRGFDEEMAYVTGKLRAATRARGLSLADRACLALAIRARLPALTADRGWADLTLDPEVEIVLLR